MSQNITLPSLKTLGESGAPRVSFEFFPPKTERMEEELWQTITELAPLQPEFVSVTYGAGGSTRERTHQTVARILKETELKPAAHLTCVAATQEEIDAVIRGYWEVGVRHIVALRGDPPGGEEKYTPHPGGYPHAVDLIEGIKKIGDFEISVACFPEVHPEAESAEADLEYLKRKVDAGADRAITQYFFDTELYFDFVDKARAKGITIPIVPGIIPVKNYAQLVKFSAMCGATIPPWVAELLEPVAEQPELHRITAAAIAAEQCRILYAGGVEHIHFYTLNNATLTRAVCHLLNVRG